MGLSSLNNVRFQFVCTNYSSNKDGIGHYTSKIVNELKKNEAFIVNVFSRNTEHLSKLNLFFSFRMSLELMRLLISLYKSPYKSFKKDYIIIEYPFVEYNPVFLLMVLFLKLLKKPDIKIVVSLHEYSRTSIFRKIFIRVLIPISDIVLYTKIEDIYPFLKRDLIFKKRIIPANIEPIEIKNTEIGNTLNICFFGIINFNTKEIKNMLAGWEMYVNQYPNNKINFHFISSTFNEDIKNNKYLMYYYGLNDYQVSSTLQKMHFIILPLTPRVSVNNGSLSVGCIHKCVPVGMFDEQHFLDGFGLNMKDYSIQEFVKTYILINGFDINLIGDKAQEAYEYGKLKSIKNSADSYAMLIKL